jgi:DNA-binding NtrC family response regulator
LTIGHEWLAAMGYRVEIAGGVEEARTLLRKRSFDLLITDVLMPGATDGFGLAEEALRAHPDLQVMFVTGHADREIPHALQKWPMLSKPIRRAELIAAARTLLEQHA